MPLDPIMPLQMRRVRRKQPPDDPLTATLSQTVTFTNTPARELEIEHSVALTQTLRADWEYGTIEDKVIFRQEPRVDSSEMWGGRYRR